MDAEQQRAILKANCKIAASMLIQCHSVEEFRFIGVQIQQIADRTLNAIAEEGRRLSFTHPERVSVTSGLIEYTKK